MRQLIKEAELIRWPRLLRRRQAALRPVTRLELFRELRQIAQHLRLRPEAVARRRADTKKGPAEPREASHSKWCRRPDLNRYVVANGRF